MKRIWLTMLVLAAVCALGGAAASSSSAAEVKCQKVFEVGTGNFNNPQCTEAGGSKEYIKVNAPGRQIGGGIYCTEVNEAGKGNYNNSNCQGTKEAGNFILEVVPGPHWHVNGTQLKQGVRQLKLQLKGSAVLTTPELKAEIRCLDSGSEGATIEGNGEGQGQGKGRVTYSQCTVLKPSECTVAEPITTKQLKSYLAYANTQTKIVSVFEPTEGTLFVTLKFSGSGCGTSLEGERGVNGSVAGEVIPSEKEGQEGLVAFPEKALGKVTHEGVEKTISLKVAGFKSTFDGAYSARLQTSEPFGVFEI